MSRDDRNWSHSSLMFQSLIVSCFALNLSESSRLDKEKKEKTSLPNAWYSIPYATAPNIILTLRHNQWSPLALPFRANVVSPLGRGPETLFSMLQEQIVCNTKRKYHRSIQSSSQEGRQWTLFPTLPREQNIKNDMKQSWTLQPGRVRRGKRYVWETML